MNTPPFVQKHFGALASVVVSAVTVAVMVGVVRFRVDEHDQRLQRAEADGTAARETRWIVDQHTRDISEMKTELRRQSDTIAEIRMDTRLIAAWVKQQQDRDARASMK